MSDTAAAKSAVTPDKPAAVAENKIITPKNDGNAGNGGGGNNNRGGGNFGGGGGRGQFRGMRGGPGGNFRGGRGGGQSPMMMGGEDGPAPPPHMLMGRGGPRGGRGGGGHFGNRGGNQGGRGGRGGQGGHGGPGGRRDFVIEKLQAIQGPTHELPPLETGEKKFSGRARLYIGNLTPDATEENLKEIMSQYGEVGEIFFNSEKHFAFLRLATRNDAERAKRELDGQMRNGRPMKVRFAPHQGAIKVSNLGPWVSNELLHRAFSIFGEIERCMVLVDDRGRSKQEGVVEFERKNSASEAIRRCQENCFFLTSSLRPVVVDMLEENDDEDGMQEKMLPKRNPDFQSERESGPRFANPGSFEHEYGQKWKSLHEMKKQKLEALEREMKLEEDKLIAQMEYARYEHETEQLRNQLRMREASRDQQKNQWEERERQTEQMLRQEQERRQEDEERMMNRMQEQEDNMRQRTQENSLFMQAQELNSMLDQQEADIQQGGFNGGGPKGGPMGGGPMGGAPMGGGPMGGGPMGGGPMGGGPMGGGPMGGGPMGGFRGGPEMDGPFGGPGGPGGNFGGPGNNFGPPMMRGGGGNFRGGRGGGGDFGGPNKRRRF